MQEDIRHVEVHVARVVVDDVVPVPAPQGRLASKVAQPLAELEQAGPASRCGGRHRARHDGAGAALQVRAGAERR